MHILYGFSNCTNKKYYELMGGTKTSILRPDQKYHSLLINGLKENGAEIKCFSGLPINRELTKKIFIHEKDEQEDGVYYHYFNTINLPFLRRISIFLGSFFGVLKVKKRNNTYIICDCLNISNCYGMMLAGKLKKIPIITIVTDIPDMMNQGKFARQINNRFFKSVDGFILLTKQMDGRINFKAKPSIVLEGHVDINLDKLDLSEKLETKTGDKIIIYAGGIRKKYGISSLVEGFILSNIDKSELHIYGDGDYSNELEKLSQKYANIKYFGVCENKEIVQAEQRAALLVNPRPSAPEYTKYSFPSKNMEYMVSGTPTLTTKLPGMPKEYYPYVYLIEDETPLGISDVLRHIFSLPMEERIKKGKAAREFVLEYKSNVKQAKKIINFLRDEVKK